MTHKLKPAYKYVATIIIAIHDNRTSTELDKKEIVAKTAKTDYPVSELISRR